MLLVAAMAAACTLAFGSATALGAPDPGAGEPAAAVEQPVETAGSPSFDAPPGPEPASPAAGESTGVGAVPEDDASTGSEPSGADAAVDVAQAVEAAASTSQQQPTNEQVSVHLDTPGETPSVEQQNAASATATADAAVELTTPGAGTTASPAGDDPDPAAPPTTTIAQHAGASAAATQLEPTNTAVTVRVGSPGDNGPVTQTNAATAVAAATTETPANGANSTQSDVNGNLPSEPHEQAHAAASAHAGQVSPSNTNVSVRIGSPGDDGQVTQSNTATATAAATPPAGPPNATATASQQGAMNTNVGIRVGSPGTTPAAQQGSTATTATGGLPFGPQNAYITSVSNGTNTDLLVDVAGAGLPDPLAGNGEFAVWIWKWTWTSTADLATKLTAGAPIDDPGSWQWDVVTGADAGAAADTPLEAGNWIWNWDWDRPGDWSWDWSWQPSTPLDCNCAWIWDWDWTWSVAAGVPDQGAPEPGAPNAVTTSTIVQRNEASAAAEASAGAGIGQSIAQDGNAEQFAGQIASVVQAADAHADTEQIAAANTWWGTEAVTQVNGVATTAASAAQVELTQSARQSGGAGDAAALAATSPGGGGPAQWSGQQAEVAQFASTTALAGQIGVTNNAATANALLVDAAAATDVIARQDVEQVATGLGRSQWAGQLVQIGQSADALAAGLQQGVADDTFSRIASAKAGAGAQAISLQGSAQTAFGQVGESSQRSAQLIVGLQDALATATTAQPAGAAVGIDDVARSSSEALATNRTLVAEASSQFVFGSGIQDVTQNAFFEQSAFASSTSLGGIGGVAGVSNCSTISQSAGQAFGAGLPGALLGDASSYCAPPPSKAPSNARASTLAGTGLAAPPEALMAPAPADAEQFPHATRGPYAGGWSAAHAQSAAVTVYQHTFDASADAGAPSRAALVAGIFVSSPPSPDEGARALDAGTGSGGKAGAEPPLPPVSGTPAGPGSLIPGLGGGGGAAATIAVLVLMLLGAWRTYSESDVRRPTFFQGALETPG